MISTDTAWVLTLIFLRTALVLQATEQLAKASVVQKVFAPSLVIKDLGQTWISRFLDITFRKGCWRALLMAQILTTVGTIYLDKCAILIAALILTHWITNLRFRGTFNGGSDILTMHMLLGWFLASTLTVPLGDQVGLGWIAAISSISYLSAGLVKLREPKWRSGKALRKLLLDSARPHIHPLQLALAWSTAKKHISVALSLALIAFELLFPALIFRGPAPLLTALIGIFFHFAVFLTLGLNRFFWVWLATYPALLSFSAPL